MSLDCPLHLFHVLCRCRWFGTASIGTSRSRLSCSRASAIGTSLAGLSCSRFGLHRLCRCSCWRFIVASIGASLRGLSCSRASSIDTSRFGLSCSRFFGIRLRALVWPLPVGRLFSPLPPGWWLFHLWWLSHRLLVLSRSSLRDRSTRQVVEIDGTSHSP